MFDKNYALAMDIKNKILTNIMYADIDIFFDKEQNEYFISTRNKELYYSEAYGKLIFEINQDILWGQGIFNFYFILDTRAREFDNASKETIFFLQNENLYKSWDVKNTHSLFAGKYTDMDNFSLAA